MADTIDLFSITKQLDQIDQVIFENEKDFLKEFAPDGFELLGVSYTSDRAIFTYFISGHITVVNDVVFIKLQPWINAKLKAQK